MKRITLSFPPGLYDAIATAAETNHRSFSGEVMARLDVPAWHNPDRLTPTQVGAAAGWRFCLVTEVEKRLPEDAEMWMVNGRWVRSVCRGRDGSPEMTYRTKAPLP